MKRLILSIQDVIKKLAYILNRKQKTYCAIMFMMTMMGVVFETLGVSIILPVVQAMLYPEQLLNNEWIGLAAGVLQLK